MIFWSRKSAVSHIEFGNQFIVSAIKFRKKTFFEVYGTDSTAGDVQLLNIYFAR